MYKCKLITPEDVAAAFPGESPERIDELIISALLGNLYKAILETETPQPEMGKPSAALLNSLVDALEEQVVDLIETNSSLEEKLVAAENKAEMFRSRLTTATNLLHAFIDKV